MPLGDELERELLECLGDKFLEALAQVPYVAYDSAHKICAEHFRGPEAENVRPWVRRGMVETLIQDSAQQFPAIETTVVRADKSAWNHTEVRSGRVILTASTVQSPCGPVEFSEYRAGFALAAAQLPGMEDDRPANAPMYVLLLHSPQSQLPMAPEDRGLLPGSIYLAWPAADLSGYVHKINLVERHFEIIRRNHLPREWTDEASVSYLRSSRAIAI
jgi:hypothetical protein